MLLVPGAAAYRGVQAWTTRGAIAGVSAEWQVLVNIGAIVAGILIAYTLTPPKRAI